MDEEMRDRIDQMTEDMVAKGYRDLVLPDHIAAAQRAACQFSPSLIPFDRVRLLQLNPAKRSRINKQVTKRYNQDLQDPDMLSTAQLRRINIERGEWSEDKEARIRELTDLTNDLMVGLSHDGFDYSAKWNQELYEAYTKARGMLDGDEALERFDRWYAWSPDRQDEYTVQYAASQHLPEYSVDRDLGWLIRAVDDPEFGDSMNQIDELRDRLRRFAECMELRSELFDLQLRQSKMLADSVEQRRDVCEEMARLYYCVERIDAEGVGLGPLTKTFDDLWEMPDDVVRFLQTKLYMFLRGQPDSDEENRFLETWGFLPAPPETGSKESSDASLVEPSSNTDSQDATATPAASSESPTATS